MFSQYNAELDVLREETYRLRRVDAMLADLDRQRGELEGRLAELADTMHIGQAEIDRLSGGFWSVFYTITGQKDDMLEKERAALLKASMLYEANQGELERVQADTARLEAEHTALWNCEQKYREALDRKLEAVRSSGGEAGMEIARLEEKKPLIAAQIREAEEAEAAGRRALQQIERIAQQMASAEDWGLWDVMGGGMISHIAKHSHLDEAQRGVRTLESMLRDFRTELADVEVQADIRVEIDGFLRFADWFFDGFFVDWSVLSRIQESQVSLDKTRGQVRRVIGRLEEIKRNLRRAYEQADQEIRSIAERA